MLDQKKRYGKVSSSGIVALLSVNKKGDDFGVPAKIYIEEKQMEIRLGRSLDTDSKAKATLWGTFLESFVFSELPLGYSYNSDETITHSENEFWVGTPDGFRYDEGKTVMDIKCPYTLKSFCQLVQPLYDGFVGMDAMNKIRETHKDGDKYYWQLVSNAILSNSKYAELIVYCPYASEIQSIKSNAEGQPNYYFIWAANDEDLPYINNDGYYKNLNIIRFEVPETDKQLLTEKVNKATALFRKILKT